jgi:hypothetical protein
MNLSGKIHGTMTRSRALLAACTVLIPALAFAQHEQHGGASPDQIGAAHVKFETSCAPAVRDDFNKAVALLHSFWFPQASAQFNEILKRDPNCAMAHWGIALSAWGNPFAGIKNPKTVEQTRMAIERAKTTGSPSARDRALIDAVAQLTTDATPGTHAARIGAYEAAMAKVAAAYPADDEIKMFWALAINQTAPATDKTYARQLKAAEILEPLFTKMPEHPGLAHYIIHAYDTPPLAPKALDAARRYASLAPAIPHALHMPSHTFTRVGYWKESIETNRRSADAARKSGGPAGAGEELHALDYQIYAYLQLARPRAHSIARCQWWAGKMVLRRAPQVPARMRSRSCRRATRSNAVNGRRPPRSRRVQRTRRIPKPSHISRVRSVRHAAAIRQRRQPTSRSWPNCATS